MLENDEQNISVTYSEEYKGGVSFELVLAEPSVATPPPRKRSITPEDDKPLTVKDIENKLKAASERRLSLETIKLNQINEQMNKIEEANQKKLEYNLNYVKAVKDKMDCKMDVSKEKREAVIREKQNKVKASLQHVEEVRQTVASQVQELMNSIQRKITNATEAREAQIKALQQKLKDHDEHVAKVKKIQVDQKEQLKEKNKKKLEVAEENRALIKKMLQEKISEHMKRIDEVRQNKIVNLNNSNTEDTNGNRESEKNIFSIHNLNFIATSKDEDNNKMEILKDQDFPEKNVDN